jgi:hypothetical protein
MRAAHSSSDTSPKTIAHMPTAYAGARPRRRLRLRERGVETGAETAATTGRACARVRAAALRRRRTRCRRLSTTAPVGATHRTFPRLRRKSPFARVRGNHRTRSPQVSSRFGTCDRSFLGPGRPAKPESAPTASAAIPTATNIRITLPTAGVTTNACSVGATTVSFAVGVASIVGDFMSVRPGGKCRVLRQGQ